MDPKVLLLNQAPKNKGLYVTSLPPLGILGMASYAGARGYPVDVIDRYVDQRPADSMMYDIVGLSVNMANVTSSLATAEKFKRINPKIKILLGGPSCIASPEEFAALPYVDAVCDCEGEEVLLDVITQYGHFESFCPPPGLRVRQKGRVVYGGGRKAIADLDSLPFPGLEKVPLHKYVFPFRRRLPVSSIITSRGCPYHCIYCSHGLGFQFRARSPENVVEEIGWQVNRLGIGEICITDDNFSHDIGRAKRIFELILRRGIKASFQFQNGLRVDLLDYELLRLMRRAGVWILGVAPETGSPAVMKTIKKGFNLEKVDQVIGWCRELGMRTCGFFMIGFPFETRDDILATINYIGRVDTDFIGICRVTVLPKTELYEMIFPGKTGADPLREMGQGHGIPEHAHPALSREELERLIHRAFRRFYLNPKRLLRYPWILPVSELIKLVRFAFGTQQLW